MKKISSLPILFLALCIASHAGAQAGVTLLVKTGISCNWKLDGQPMGLLTADRPTVVLVTPGEHLVEASPTDGAATIFTKVEIDKADTLEKTVNIGLKTQTGQQRERPQAETPKEPAPRNDAAQNPTWLDPATGLMWTGNDNGSDVDQPQAANYCSTLQYAGHSDWRLATLEELQGIYDSSNSSEVKVVSGIQYEVHVKGHLNLTTGWVWSDRPGDSPGRPYQTAWLFQFFDLPTPFFDKGKPRSNFLHFDFQMRALCVRRPEM
jgi:hypothetical protein